MALAGDARLAGKRSFANPAGSFANPARCRLTMRELAGIPVTMGTRRLAIELFVVAAAGLVLGVFGPFGTFAAPTAPRLLYWVGFMLAGYAFFRPLIAVGHWLAEAFALPRWLATGLALALASLPMSLLVATVLSGFDWRRGLLAQDFLIVYLDVLLIGVLVNGLFHLLGRHERVADSPDEPPADRAAVAETAAPILGETVFARRLPAGFGPLLALAGEDHYVRAIAPSRETLVLVRLRDAIAELDGIDGLQVHRSWWVARDGVATVRRDGRSLVVVLASGHEVPVARDKSALLRQAGWLGAS